MAYNKIFFNGGVAAQADGLGAMIAKCDAAGIPVFIASTDGTMGLIDLQTARALSGVPHQGSFRATGYVGNIHLDVPNYNLPANDAAAVHWAAHKPKIPPELNKAVHWISTANECRHIVGWGTDAPNPAWAEQYTGWADWMGHYSHAIALLAMADGYKYAAFGWSSGTPAEGAWEQPWMVKYLELCAAYPEQVAIALHEYSFEVDNIWHLEGDHIGRFEKIFALCDARGLERPSIIITEWGWEHNDAPAVAKAMDDVHEVAAYYAQFPTIIGAAAWTLLKDDKWGGIYKKIQPLITPIGEFTVNTTFPDPVPPPTPPPDPEPGDCRGKPRGQYKRVYWVYPGHATEAQRGYIAALASAQQITCGPSYDDSGLGDLDDKTAVLWGIDPAERLVFLDWYAQWYPGTAVEFRDMPDDDSGTVDPPPIPEPTGSAGIGLHASADPGDLHGGTAEFVEFKTLKPDVIKVLSAHSAVSIERLAADQKAIGNFPKWIIRAFLAGWDRTVSAQDFFNWTKDDVLRAVTTLVPKYADYDDLVIELHNEPNLTIEGWGKNWNDGKQFASWLINVLALYRAAVPNVRFMYPGLSPGGDVAGIRYDSSRFLAESMSAANACDDVGIHSYWVSAEDMVVGALATIDGYEQTFPGKRLWITEASRKRPLPTSPAPTAAQMAFDYTWFWDELQYRPQVKGVTYFVASASDPAFAAEAWVVNGKSRGIAGMLRQ